MCGPSERISALEVGAEIGKMKQGKSAGPTGAVAEMLIKLKAAGKTGTLWLTDVCEGWLSTRGLEQEWDGECLLW